MVSSILFRGGDRDYELHLWFRMVEIVEDLDQAKALAHEHHLLAESSKPAEIGPMGTTPIGQAPIPFTLLIGKVWIDLIEASIGHFGGFDDTSRLPTSVEYNPALAGRRGVRLVFRATSCGLDPFDDKFKQLICEFRTVAEGECSEVLIPFGDWLAHGAPNQSNWPNPACKYFVSGNVACWHSCDMPNDAADVR